MIYYIVGVKSDKQWLVHKIRKNRKPLDSSQKFHNMLNNGFKNIFGIPLRSSSFFCVKDRYTTDPYGVCYTCFPSNEYVYYYSNTIHDAFAGNWLEHDHSKAVKIANKNDKLIAYILLYIYYNKDINLFTPILSGKELNFTILPIQPPQEILYSKNIKNTFIKSTTPEITLFIKQLEKIYPDCSTEFVKTFYKKTKSLEKINEYTEIMIQCKEMYMVDSLDTDLIDKILEG